MQFTQTAALLLTTLATAEAAAWGMTSWTGRSCLSGKVGKWSVGPGTKSCITFASVLSLNVTSAGACTTTYYSDNNCATASYLANQGICDGFNGGPVGSFKVSCTD
ncbi:MAG: hypothetical protein MMC23_003937 [Stictis urceolatum]|nr:hypothetical protein [Stictis urceolata]